MNDATSAADQLVTIPAANLYRVEEFFKKLGTRARRTKLAPPCYIEVSRETVMVKASTFGLEIKGDPMVPREFVTLQVAGNRPHIPGYTFVGTVQHGEGEFNVLKAAPDQVVPETYRKAGRVCDHCKTRRNRKETFVMFEEVTGLYKQIARNCLQDYLGEGVDVKSMVKQFEWWSEALTAIGEWDGFCGGGSRGDHEDLLHFVAITACMTRKFGFKPSSFGADSTVSTTWQVMYPPMDPSPLDKAFLAEIEILDCDLEMATKALEWLRSVPELEITGYIGNMFAACQSDAFHTKNGGLVASLVSAYSRAMGYEKKQQERAERPESQYVGEVGVRSKGLVVKVKVLKLKTNYMGNGYSTFCVMEDATGNVMVWPASANLGAQYDLDVGDVITIDGKVKKHEISSHPKFGDTKQTWLTGCTIKNIDKVEEEDDAA